MDWSADAFTALSLVVALAVVGWGFGLAAALLRCSVNGGSSSTRRAQILGVCLAVLLAFTSSYAYALVLDVTGVIDYCDPVYNALRPC